MTPRSFIRDTQNPLVFDPANLLVRSAKSVTAVCVRILLGTTSSWSLLSSHYMFNNSSSQHHKLSGTRESMAVDFRLDGLLALHRDCFWPGPSY